MYGSTRSHMHYDYNIIIGNKISYYCAHMQNKYMQHEYFLVTSQRSRCLAVRELGTVD